MKVIYFSFLFLCMTMLLSLVTSGRDKGWTSAHDNISFYFMENKGQIVDQYGQPRHDIDFSIAAHGVTVFVGSGQIHYQWLKPQGDIRAIIKDRKSSHQLTGAPLMLESYRMDVSLLGANIQAPLVKEGRQDYYERYYLPQCGDEGALAYSYKKMVYKNVYPHIDWVIYVKGTAVEYDFVVYPGGKVSDIQLQYGGAERLSIQEDGSLKAVTPLGAVTESAPYSFQEDGKVIAAQFKLEDKVLRFHTQSHTGILTIDPILKWATYYGGAGYLEDMNDEVMDRQDQLYVCGRTTSPSNIATVGAYQTVLSSVGDAFFVKFNTDGKRMWGTYYGGENSEEGTGITVDTLGNIYMSGMTWSKTGVATSKSHQENYGDMRGLSDGFLVKFDSSGARKWATYYGGEGLETYPEIEYNNGYLYLVGGTASKINMATVGAFRENKSGSSSSGDAFLAKFSVDGIRQWGTYFGGNGPEPSLHASIAADKSGNIYIAGGTASTDSLATPNSHQTTRRGSEDLFLAKFNDKGNLLWSTYYGGDNTERPYGGSIVFCDSLDNVYLTGTTLSPVGIATTGASQPTYAGKSDGFLVKFNSAGERLWGTYLGGDGDEQYCSVLVGKDGNVFVAGCTDSDTGIVTPRALQQSYGGTNGLTGDAFFAKYSPSGEKLYGTYFGSRGDDHGARLVMDHSGDLYMCGITNSVAGLATTGSHQDTYPGGLLWNGFVAKFCLAAISWNIKGQDTTCAFAAATYTVDSVTDVDAYIWTLSDGLSGSSTGNSITVTNKGTGGKVSVQIVRCGDTSSTQTWDVAIYPYDPAIINVDGFLLGTIGTYKSYTWLLNGVPIPGANKSTYQVVENGNYSVITENEHGCLDTSDAYKVSNVSVEELTGIAKSIHVYPNPASRLLKIDSRIPVSVSLMSMDGRLLLQAEKASSIDISTLPPAIYMLRIFSQEGNLLKTEKFSKMEME